MYRGDDPPQRERQSIVDISTGMTMIYSILAALYARERSGIGQRIDLSMLGAMMSVQTPRFVDGPKDELPFERSLGASATYRPYKTQDDWVIIAVLNDNLFRRLCRALACTELCEDPRFATHPERVVHEAELTAILEDTLQQKPASVWLERLEAEGVPCSPVQPLNALFDNAQMQANDLVKEVDHPRIGKLKTYGIGPKFSETPLDIRTPPPDLGEHNDMILSELGYRADEITALREQGALG